MAQVELLEQSMMARAIELAKLGHPRPNPPVGCVVCAGAPAQQIIVGEGFHSRAGAEHAEVHALAEAGDKARGATLFVTLEPCNHWGRTPPCVDAVLRADIRRVVVACRDPNRAIRGGGIERLVSAGVIVSVGLAEQEAAHLLSEWFSAFSEDGKLVQASGASGRKIDGGIPPAKKEREK